MKAGRFLSPGFFSAACSSRHGQDLTQQAPWAFLAQWTNPAKDWTFLVREANCVEGPRVSAGPRLSSQLAGLPPSEPR